MLTDNIRYDDVLVFTDKNNHYVTIDEVGTKRFPVYAMEKVLELVRSAVSTKEAYKLVYGQLNEEN